LADPHSFELHYPQEVREYREDVDIESFKTVKKKYVRSRNISTPEGRAIEYKRIMAAHNLSDVEKAKLVKYFDRLDKKELKSTLNILHCMEKAEQTSKFASYIRLV
jgi:hypothetical protein